MKKIYLFNLLQKIRLAIFHNVFLCETNSHSHEDVFYCERCFRLLCLCHLNTAIFDAEDQFICIDCWESKYREEIVVFNDTFISLISEIIKDIPDTEEK
jgi:hypothetical protein